MALKVQHGVDMAGCHDLCEGSLALAEVGLEQLGLARRQSTGTGGFKRAEGSDDTSEAIAYGGDAEFDAFIDKDSTVEPDDSAGADNVFGDICGLGGIGERIVGMAADDGCVAFAAGKNVFQPFGSVDTDKIGNAFGGWENENMTGGIRIGVGVGRGFR